VKVGDATIFFGRLRRTPPLLNGLHLHVSQRMSAEASHKVQAMARQKTSRK